MFNPLSFGYAGLSYLHFTNKIGTTLPFFLQKKTSNQLTRNKSACEVWPRDCRAGAILYNNDFYQDISSRFHQGLDGYTMDTPLTETWTAGRTSKIEREKYGKIILQKFSITSWWLNQPIWKICSSNWIISPGRGENKKKLSCHHVDYVNLSQGGILFFQKPGASGGFVVISKSTTCLIGLKLGVLLAFISQKWISCSQLPNNLESIKIITLIKRRVGLSIQGSPLDACCSNFWRWCPADGMHHSYAQNLLLLRKPSNGSRLRLRILDHLGILRRNFRFIWGFVFFSRSLST